MPELTTLSENIRSQVTEKIDEASKKTAGYIKQAESKCQEQSEYSESGIRNVRMEALACYKEIKDDILETVLHASMQDERIDTLYKIQDLNKKIIAGKKRYLMLRAFIAFVCIAVSFFALRFVFLLANLSYEAAFFVAFLFIVLIVFVFGRRLFSSYAVYMDWGKDGKSIGCGKKNKKLIDELIMMKEQIWKSNLGESPVPEDNDVFIRQVLGAIEKSGIQQYKECCILLKEAAEKELGHINEELERYIANKKEIRSMGVSEKEKAELDSLGGIEDISKHEIVDKYFETVGEKIRQQGHEKNGDVKALSIAAVCLLLFISAAFFLCQKEEAEGYTFADGVYKNNESAALVILLGNHANSMKTPKDAYDEIEKMLDGAIYGGYLCAVIVDATPTKIDLVEDRSFFQEDAKNLVTLRRRIEKRKGEIIDRLKNLNASADSPEVDLLAALREAENAFKNSQVYNMEHKQICIIDTGISTSGDLNFANMNFLYNKPDIQKIVDRLETYEGTGVLPDLSGTKVVFIGTARGLAEAAKPQEVFDTDKEFIKNLWYKVIEACGVKGDDITTRSVAGWDTPNVYTEDADCEFPHVSVITFSHEKVIDFPEEAGDEELTQNSPVSIEIKLASEVIGFKPDGKDYLNEENAYNLLQPFAKELKEYFRYYPDEKIWLAGTTAAVQKGAAGSVDLSLQRAETVKNTLVAQFGIPEEKLVTIGLGAKFPWHIDEYPDGLFDTAIAQANRAVWILTAHMDTDYFNQLKTAYDNGELLPEAMQRFSVLY